MPLDTMDARASVNRSRTRRLMRPALLTALAGGAAGAALIERSHLRSIAADPDFRALSAPLSGRPVPGVVSADGTVLHAERFGAADAPATLVLGPGWTETIAYWGPIIRRLAGPGLAIVAYDLRGQGSSEPARSGDYAIERFGEDLGAVLEAIDSPPDRTVVAGHSLGAMSIAAWASRGEVGARVAAAALMNTGLSQLLGGGLVLGSLGARLAPERLGRALVGSSRPVLPVSTPISQSVTRHVAFGPDASDGTVAFYERMFLQADPRVRGAIGLLFSTLDILSAAGSLTVPTLVVAGDRDRLTPAVHARRIHAALPRPTRLVELDRTGHMSPLERPDAIAAQLEALLREAGVTPGGRGAAGAPG